MNHVIAEACKTYGVSEAEFFSRLFRRPIPAARRKAINDLRAEGLTIPEIAATMKRAKSTVSYWLIPKKAH